MIRVIQSPEQIGICDLNKAHHSVFLAGGISGCPDWQSEFIDHCHSYMPKGYNTALINPRRVGDLAKNGVDARAQIEWERYHLQACSHIIFWFPKETLCPITLFELGQYATKENLLSNKVIVGCDPEYQRSFDLSVQLYLVAGTSIRIYNSVEDLAYRAACVLGSFN